VKLSSQAAFANLELEQPQTLIGIVKEWVPNVHQARSNGTRGGEGRPESLSLNKKIFGVSLRSLCAESLFFIKLKSLSAAEDAVDMRRHHSGFRGVDHPAPHVLARYLDIIWRVFRRWMAELQLRCFGDKCYLTRLFLMKIMNSSNSSRFCSFLGH
jgi:hypothetical protein